MVSGSLGEQFEVGAVQEAVKLGILKKYL